jgi:hypothetical protein
VALISQVAVAAIDVPDTGNLRDDIRAYLDNGHAALSHPLATKIIPDLLAEAVRNSELAEALMDTVRGPRRSKAATVIRRAVERGELPEDTDIELALDLLAGPLYWRLTVVRMGVDEAYYDRLTDKLVAALLA